MNRHYLRFALLTSLVLSAAPLKAQEDGQTLAELLQQHRDVNTTNDELDRIVVRTAFIIDAVIFEAAMDVATDPAAGTVARVQSIRALASQVIPGYLVPYSAFAEPELGAYGGLIELAARSEPLSEEFSIRTEDAMQGVLASEGLPDVIQNAATHLLNQMVIKLYCDQAMSLGECFDVIVSKTRDKSGKSDKSKKSDKSDKSDKSKKSDKSGKSDKSSKG